MDEANTPTIVDVHEPHADVRPETADQHWPADRHPRFRVGQKVRIKKIGCDCPPKFKGDRCYRHDWVGEVGTVDEIEFEDSGLFTYYLAELPCEDFYDDELTGTRKAVTL